MLRALAAGIEITARIICRVGILTLSQATGRRDGAYRSMSAQERRTGYYTPLQNMRRVKL